jgi:hypothetical protein
MGVPYNTRLDSSVGQKNNELTLYLMDTGTHADLYKK